MLTMLNKAFEAETKSWFISLEKETIRILQYKTDDTQLATAVKRVFAGDTFILENLRSLFSMFSWITRQNATQPDRFNKVVIFPVPADDATITHGVIVFMP